MSDPFSAPPTSPVDPAPAPVEPLPVVMTTKPVKRNGRSGTMLLAAAGVVAVAGLAFAAGRLTAPAAAAGGTGGNGGGRFGGFPGASFEPGQGFRNGTGGPGGIVLNGGRGSIDLRGQVTAVTDTSITIKLDNGSEVTVPLDSSTTYHQATEATASAVTVGSTVDVQPGAANFTPGASPNPAASGAPGLGGVTFGPATDVTVVPQASPTP